LKDWRCLDWAELTALCLRHTIPADGPRVVIAEPYLPYVPAGWDGMLVLAEAQNLTDGWYVERLRRQTPTERVLRLQEGYSETDIGVQPWDDTHLKLAVEAAFGVDPSVVAVSNAVPWSQVSGPRTNANPEGALEHLAARFWTDLLPLLRPGHIVTVGTVARRVVTSVSDDVWSGRLTVLTSASPRYLSRIAPMFDSGDLLRRFPEVRAVLDRRPEYAKEGFARNRVLFACHAVSVAAGADRSC
jgi:hypothetical protein